MILLYFGKEDVTIAYEKKRKNETNKYRLRSYLKCHLSCILSCKEDDCCTVLENNAQ